jgi:CMP-N-acetylneuraminic acid synthetase
MFLHNVEKCLKIFDLVYVSSDSNEMLDMAIKLGAKILKRPERLCGDTPNITVYQSDIEWMQSSIDGIVAVQANSPTISPELIREAKHAMECGEEEVMTVHPDGSIYGSIWGITKNRLKHYQDPYKPTPTFTLVDNSIDIHTEDDMLEANQQVF